MKITYRFDVAQNATFDADYLVFLHVIEPDGEKLWQDDHAPSVPTSQWKPGQTVEYTRTIFVPNYPYIGEANLRIGLYNPSGGKRLSLDAPEVSRHEYLTGKITLLPQSENIFLIYDINKGWHSAEVDSTDPTREWQWTRKEAVISLTNPKRDATFYLEWDARTDLFNPPQQVVVKVGGQPVGTFAAASKDRTLTTFPITAAQFGADNMSEITIEVDRTFSGSGNDTRELGIRIFHAFVEPK
ncbi:MAG: hypothetical protein M3468_10185 [Acidobacteriota bacterium]|nr:hypothetical protein [Acidobacteriota bacterium]